MTKKEWLMIAAFVLGTFVLVMTPRQIERYYFESHKICATVSKVYACAGYQYNSECRVDMNNGKRITTNRLVAEGDNYCWLP